MVVYKYSQLSEKTMSYKEAIKQCDGKIMHLGQLKLFFSELIFLTMHAKPGYTVLYVGAAEGYHTSKMADLFPDLKFDLWDPEPFHLEDRPNITLHNDFFTTEMAKKYAESGKQILFMCDMRNLEIGKYKTQISKMDVIVHNDMILQLQWCQIIKPIYAYLKFRLEYDIPKTEYLTGTIYLQPYSKLSTEARLMTKDYSTMMTYNNLEFDGKMSYFNAHIRCGKHKYKKWESIIKKYNLVNNWDNVVALHITHFYLRHMKREVSMNDVGILFMEIINFHMKKYGAKYNILFDRRTKKRFIKT